MSRNPRPTVAMVEDADEDGRVIDGSGHYARSNALSPSSSPLRQQMNTSKKKSSRRRDPSMSPPEYDLESDMPSPPSRPSRRDSKTEKKRSSMGGSKGKTVVLKEDPRPRRPSTRTAKTAPGAPPRGMSDEASYYGIPSQTIIPSQSRPRAATARPASYYGTTRPPLSHSAYYGGSPALGTSFPPPAWGGGPPGMPPMGPPQMMAHSPLSGPPVDYFSNNPRPTDTLAARFSRQGEPRPRSSLGFRGGPPPSAYEDYEQSQVMEVAAPPQRHGSLARRPKKEKDDRARMPPPARPQTTKPERLVFRAPPPSRKSAHFVEDDVTTDGEGEDGFYHPAPGRHDSYEYGTAVVPSRPRRTSIDSEDYEDGVFALEQSGHNRRHSSYNSIEDKIKQASAYQQEVAQASPAPLTADALRRVKNGGTSRSSRSTQSRDESSYKQSATTRTTRSSSGDDDITIKVPDGAIVEVGNAKISCRMGGEINIGRNNGGSDRGTVYDDERKSRAIEEDRKSRAIEEDRRIKAIEDDHKSRAYEDDRRSRAYDEDRKSRAYDEEPRKSRTNKLATRNRASSQSGSFSRSLYGGHDGYAPPFASHYGSPAHYAPPYPQYPSSEYDYYET